MALFIKTKFKKSDDQTNIDKYRVAADEAIISCKKCSKWTYGLFGHNYRVAALSTLYLTVLWIIIPSLKYLN